MKHFLNFPIGIVAAVLFCCLWAGCASTPVVDWNSRIGNFTYEQAVKELGQPAESKKQADGGTIAEWLMSRDERRVTQGVGTGMAASGSAGGIAQPMAPQPHDQYLQLAFDKDGKLSAWKRLVH